MNPVIETNDLVKTYEGKPVIDHLSLSFPEGKVTGLLGPNGAGKSTLLKMVIGQVKPDSGSLKVFGRSPSWAINHDISYLPDRAKWYHFHTVEHALAYANQVFPLFNYEKAKEMAGSMQLDFNLEVESLSKGQQICLMLSICLAREAKLIILDEPFSGLDLIYRERITHSIIDSLDGKDRTFIICTHEIYEAESLFEYVVFLGDGQLLKAGDADDLRARDGSIESVYRGLYL